MFLDPMKFVRKDQTAFEIEPVLILGDEENPNRVVVRVWKDGVVINDPKSVVFSNENDAFDAGIVFCRAWKERV